VEQVQRATAATLLAGDSIRPMFPDKEP
jgi:hypothetical protein